MEREQREVTTYTVYLSSKEEILYTASATEQKIYL